MQWNYGSVVCLFSLCSHVCMYWPEIFCLKALVLSVHMYVLAFQDQHTLPKWYILSLLVYKQPIRQNISLCEGVLVLEGQYIHTSRENNSFETEYFWPIHTYMWAKRERNRWISCFLIVRKTMSGLPFQNYGSLTVCQTGNDDVWLCDWTSKTLHK